MLDAQELLPRVELYSLPCPSPDKGRERHPKPHPPIAKLSPEKDRVPGCGCGKTTVIAGEPSIILSPEYPVFTLSCSTGHRHTAHPETFSTRSDNGGKREERQTHRPGVPVPPCWVRGLSLLLGPVLPCWVWGPILLGLRSLSCPAGSGA